MIHPEIFKRFRLEGYFSHRLPKERVLTLFPESFFPKQIHSNQVLNLDQAYPPFSLVGDAVLIQLPRITLGVQTADCLPILIADKGKKVVSAVHAGWRGTLNGILFKTLEKILTLGFSPEDLLIAIGPHIQARCYEVGEDLVEKLDSSLRKEPFLTRSGGNFYLNLSALNIMQAKSLGVPEENIWVSGECTHCNSEKFHSFRRERNYLYTQVALIRIV